jgi:hypothetical protein
LVLGLIAGNVEEQVESGVSALTMEPIFVDVNFEEFVSSPLSSIRYEQNEAPNQEPDAEEESLIPPVQEVSNEPKSSPSVSASKFRGLSPICFSSLALTTLSVGNCSSSEQPKSDQCSEKSVVSKPDEEKHAELNGLNSPPDKGRVE